LALSGLSRQGPPKGRLMRRQSAADNNRILTGRRASGLELWSPKLSSFPHVKPASERWEYPAFRFMGLFAEPSYTAAWRRRCCLLRRPWNSARNTFLPRAARSRLSGFTYSVGPTWRGHDARSQHLRSRTRGSFRASRLPWPPLL